MLVQHTPHAVIAASDLERSREFYERVLGFTGGESTPGGHLYPVGAGFVMVYQTQYAGTNEATALGFTLDSDAFDAEVDGLRNAGVEFDTFDLDGVTWQDGVAHMGAASAVWFRDPDGNSIAVSSQISETD
jgi:catechol 2,3-dioxygenase-like lactoylglutathione lyase family enzyme